MKFHGGPLDGAELTVKGELWPSHIDVKLQSCIIGDPAKPDNLVIRWLSAEGTYRYEWRDDSGDEVIGDDPDDYRPPTSPEHYVFVDILAKQAEQNGT